MKKLLFCKKIVTYICLLFFAGILCISAPIKAEAAEEVITAEDSSDTTVTSDATDLLPDGQNTLEITYNNGNGELNGALRILLILTAISFLPAMLIMLTSFTRIIIVMHFTRAALGTQTAPPNQVLIGISIFLTLFIMGPIFTEINETALKPLDQGLITEEQALEYAMEPLREFMYGQTQSKDVSVFMEISGNTWDGTPESVPTSVLIPSFILSELRTSFIIGFLIYIPFIVIDMVVSSVLMSMGMMMLPPTTISMPFKILLFVLADGWNLVIVNLVRTFY
ncbi:MAG: flagellar type III secretion system pore protein FliP [Lachnospiraceae bacterium]|nr:flagellar type III secretion system pore protein FliP [Lachnospiraceae bacterium]